tara:strand:- start:425 stop:757 length:333 start_codon:yes stop_codon:yes gene_type:complete
MIYFTKYFFFSFIFTTFLCVGQTKEIVVLEKLTPPTKVVKQTLQKRAFIWIQGQWNIIEDRYVWRDGYWTPKKKGYVFVNGKWQSHKKGWVWNQGYWKKIDLKKWNSIYS